MTVGRRRAPFTAALAWSLLGALALLAPGALAAAPTGGAWTVPPPAERWSDDPGEGVLYEIFVRSFADADGDGIGDFRGLRSRLAYLEWLGVSGLWLMPIHPSPTYHGYDVIDYRAIAPELGTTADFLSFLDEAHARGMRVILDLVVNHTSSEHPWFVAARAGDEAYRALYVWSDERLDWRGTSGGSAWHAAGDGTYYLGLFEGGMPDLNHRNPDVTRATLDVAAYWLDLGVDGFRIDAIQHVIESDTGVIANTSENYEWVRDFNAALRGRHPGAFIVGETWTSTPAIAAYHRDADLDMSFNYPLWRALLSAVSTRSAIDLRAQLELDASSYPERARRGTFVSNHDQTRPATSLSPLRRDERRLALAAGLLLTLPGTPFIYYGEEIGLPNGPSDDDRDKRTPMRWTADATGGFGAGAPRRFRLGGGPAVGVGAQRAVPNSLLHVYRDLVSLRAEVAALRSGSVEVVGGLPSTLLAYWREEGGERVLVLANLGAAAVEIDVAALGLERPLDLLRGVALGGTVELAATSLLVLGARRHRAR
ncbi:alpha-amylase family glycosyl hydrolase [soil metagenome]